jgi:hypothetical protein
MQGQGEVGWAWAWQARVLMLHIARFSCLRLLKPLCSALLLPAVARAAFSPSSRLPPDFAKNVPARLVFSTEELAVCVNDPTATRCVLRGEPGRARERAPAACGMCSERAGTAECMQHCQCELHALTCTLHTACAPALHCLSHSAHHL